MSQERTEAPGHTRADTVVRPRSDKPTAADGARETLAGVPVRKPADLARSSFALLSLQRHAGNRAVTGLAGRPGRDTAETADLEAPTPVEDMSADLVNGSPPPGGADGLPPTPPSPPDQPPSAPPSSADQPPAAPPSPPDQPPSAPPSSADQPPAAPPSSPDGSLGSAGARSPLAAGSSAPPVAAPASAGPILLGGRRLSTIQLDATGRPARPGPGALSVQRDPVQAGTPPSTVASSRATSQKAPPPGPWYKLSPGSPEPSYVFDHMSQIFASCDTLTPDPGFKGKPDVFKPLFAEIYFEDYIVVVDRGGHPLRVRDQDKPPTMPDEPLALILELATSQRFILMVNDKRDLRAESFVDDDATPVKGVELGQSVLVVFVPGGVVTPEVAASLRQRARGGSGTGAEAPAWAHDTVGRLKSRRAAGTAGSGTAGSGTAGQGPGAKGGDTQGADTKGGDGKGADPKAGNQVPGSAGTISNPPAQLPLKGTPSFALRTDSAGKPELAVSLDQAHTAVKLVEGETDAALDKRIDAAITDLQASRDPDQALGVVKGAPTTGFQAPPKGSADAVVDPAKATEQAKSTPTGATPGERTLGTKGASGANTPAYPSKITMDGQEQTAAITTLGATNAFDMILDYAAMSFGVADEVFNRMQEINFYWELLDVTGMKPEEKEAAKHDPTVGADKSKEVTPTSGVSRNIGRTLDDVAEDQQADVDMMAKEDWPWVARAQYLSVIGISNAVRLIGSLISAYVSLITEPLNEQSIGFDREGEFLLRCVATPIVPEEARADPDHHTLRASSVKAMPVKVMNVSARAKEAIGAEDRKLAELEAKVRNAKTDDERKAAEATLAAFKKTAQEGGIEHFESTVAGVRQQLKSALALKAHLAKNDPEETWGLPELYLQIALLTGKEDVDTRIKTLQDQLVAVAGEGADASGKLGEHEIWTREQSGQLKAGRNYRPRVVLASRENGQVTAVSECMLGETKASTEAHQQWRFVDMTSASSRDEYDGASTQAGTAGTQEAIRNAFRAFAENNGYGRGTIAIRLPADLLAEFPGITIEERMVSAPGSKGRMMQRLSDLAKAAEVAGIVATGGAAAGIGAVGGIAGAIVSIDSLVRRARTGHVLEVGTIFDILGVVGGVASVAGLGTALGRAHLEELTAAGRPRPSWVSRLETTESALHIHGTLNNVAQVIIIPYTVINELNQIDAQGGAEGDREARRALALLQAIKSGAVTIVQVSGHGSGEDEQAAKSTDEDLPPGFRGDQADAHADGQGGPLPPVKADDQVGGQGGGAKDTAPTGTAGTDTKVTTPSEAELVAAAHQAALVRSRQSHDAITTEQESGTHPAATTQPGSTVSEGGTAVHAQEPGATGDKGTTGATGDKGTTGATGDKGTAGTGDKGTTGATGDKGSTGEGGTSTPGPTGGEATTGDAAQAELLDGLAKVVEKQGAKPTSETVRPDATTTSAAADADAVQVLKGSGDFGAVRHSVDAMASLTPAQRTALKARLQEARLAVTNEQLGAVLGRMQEKFPDLAFVVQDLGTVGFGSDRDVTIRVTPKDPAAFAKLSEAEQAASVRQAIQASAEAVPELYGALDKAGYPSERGLDTNFYTELHESMVKPASRSEAAQIAADQQIVSLSEILINAGPEGFHEYVGQQRAAIDKLATTGTPEAMVAELRQRLEAQVAAAEANVNRLLPAGGGEAHGGTAGEARTQALQAARQRLVDALKTDPPPSARELRQLMADIKLLEPDAYGTRAAVEGVVLGGQALKSATMEQVRAEHYRTQKEIQENKGQPGPTRFNEATGAMEEVSAESELARRRADAQAHIGSRRPGDQDASAYEINVGHLEVMEAVLGHLMGHQPGADEVGPADASTSAKNLGRIVSEADDLHIKVSDPALRHLPDIVAAKNAADPARAVEHALTGWKAEPSVESWMKANPMPTGTPQELMGAFLAWSHDQAMGLVTQARTRTETAAYGEGAPVGATSSAPPATSD